MAELTLTLPFPPSVNAYWRNINGRTLISEKGRQFRINTLASVYEQLKRKPTPIEENVSVLVRLYPPTHQRRDIDNFLKAPFDALTHAGIWVDDQQVKHMDVRFMDVVKGGRVDIIIRPFNKDVMYGHK